LTADETDNGVDIVDPGLRRIYRMARKRATA